MLSRFFRKIKPLLATILLVTVLAPALTVPQKAEAEYITGGWLDNIWHIPQLTPIITATGAETQQSFFKWAQTFVLETLKKRILDLMVDEIVNWIQGEGDPKFVTDWGQFLEDAGNAALSELAMRVGGAGLCEPFKSGILRNLTVPEPETFSNGSLYGSSITCTLDDIVDNIDSFYEDFSNGGWAAYSESLEIQNSPIQVYILTESAKFQTIAAAQYAAQLEATAGNGFLSSRTCFENPTSNGPDLDGDKTKGDVASTCRITTPGAVIGDLVGKAVGSDIDYIVNAEQLAAYMAAIADALWNRLIRDGVSGLAGLSTDNAPEGGFIPAGAEGCLALGTPSLINACEDYLSSNGGNFDYVWDNLLAEIRAARINLERLKTALVAWKAVADELNDFLIGESATRPSTCITDALQGHFSDPTLAGVAAYVAAINAQIQTVDERLVLLESFRLQIESLPEEQWAAFIPTATSIQTQVSSFRVTNEQTEDQIEGIDADRVALNVASESDIQPDVLLCR